MYWLVLLDDYSAGFGLMVVVITTCLVVTRVYGKRVCPMGSWGRAGMTKRVGYSDKEVFGGSRTEASSLAVEHEAPLLVSPSLDSLPGDICGTEPGPSDQLGPPSCISSWEEKCFFAVRGKCKSLLLPLWSWEMAAAESLSLSLL